MKTIARKFHGPSVGLVAAVALAPAIAWAWEPIIPTYDPLVHMPGTQPSAENTVTAASECMTCHAGYNPAVEPGFVWRGSMMAQSARDFFFWAGMTVAAQDSIWAFGTPNAADMCERCHMPKGWLELRSDPPNGLAMSGADFDGVQCDMCHRMVDPFFEATFAGVREGDAWQSYWDETGASGTPSKAAAEATRAADIEASSSFLLFNGQPFYSAASHEPVSPAYTESSNGQYFVSKGEQKRGPFADANAIHPMLYSRYHKSKFFCSSCHDVSNTPVANGAFKGTQPGDGSTVLPSEQMPAYAYAHVERTFSEFMLSDYGLPGGSPGVGPFAPEAFKTSQPGNAIATCQDCHMSDAEGKGCKIITALDRPSGSDEHPSSGQPLHDLTGGNTLVPYVLASTVPGSPNYDATNAALLGQGAGALTLDLEHGMGLDAPALLAGRNRALAQLTRAASIQNMAYDAASGALAFRVQNQTGHKLISGYPEGRRMFVNVKLFAKGDLLHEVNPYDGAAGTLKGLDPAFSPSSPPLGPSESYADDLVYEAKMQSSLTGETHTFHFVLATGRAKDNRIPPKGFRVAEAPARMTEPVQLGAPDPSLFTAAEYAGGYDDVAIALPAGGDAVVVSLYYQTTSREYVEFLRDEIEGSGTSLTSPTPSGEPAAYIAQSDPFFGQLKAWGGTIWQLWEHNKDVPGAAPVRMAQAEVVVKDVCAEPGALAGSPCNDGSACTTGDACSEGACAGGPAPSCDDGNECTADACDDALGCTHGWSAGPCDDGNKCTMNDACAFGVCAGATLPCNDGDVCTADSCDPAIGCVSTPIPDCPAGTGGGGSAASGSGTGGSGGAGGSVGEGGSGGTAAGTGGQGGAGTSSSGGASQNPDTGGEDGGCDCSAPGGAASDMSAEGALAAAGLALALGASARRRGRRRDR